MVAITVEKENGIVTFMFNDGDRLVIDKMLTETSGPGFCKVMTDREKQQLLRALFDELNP